MMNCDEDNLKVCDVIQHDSGVCYTEFSILIVVYMYLIFFYVANVYFM